jgi:CheY-like chemotaxis protein
MLETKRIFIADDDEAALTSLKKLLILSGFEVDATKNPKEAILKVKFFKPHIILLDLLMPALGGLEICEMLNNDKETQSIPVIITSALGGYTDIKKAYHLGVVGYFTKPYEFSQLLQEIKKNIASKEGAG